MPFPIVDYSAWRAAASKELAGVSFEKALVSQIPEGIALQPLYIEGPPTGAVPIDASDEPFRICMRHDAPGDESAVLADVEGGAEALWLREDPTDPASERAGSDLLVHVNPSRTFVVLDAPSGGPLAALDRIAQRAGFGVDVAFALATDPLGSLAAGHTTADELDRDLERLVGAAGATAKQYERATSVLVSTLPYHDAGADGADEIAFALATGVAYLRALVLGGLEPSVAAGQIALQVAVGRDTFVELCKVRALRVVWQKVLASVGATAAPRTRIHAVASSRTLTQRDPWVNLLRVTTQVFAAVLGGADLVTPAAFDQALGSPSALARRVARNTGLVLRDESQLGRVKDPAGGSYYLETVTDGLAREGWRRFQSIEREGGQRAALTGGRVRARLEAAWEARLALVAKRRAAIVGVTEFANLTEALPEARLRKAATFPGALPIHRDAEAFEELRRHADALSVHPEAVLLTLGPLAESRPRVGFATGFFGAGGVRVRETTSAIPGVVACICGSDERYATEAAAQASALKAAGARCVLLAGRPGALEAELRAAGVDGFLYVGCDALSVLTEILGAFR